MDNPLVDGVRSDPERERDQGVCMRCVCWLHSQVTNKTNRETIEAVAHEIRGNPPPLVVYESERRAEL